MAAHSDSITLIGSQGDLTRIKKLLFRFIVKRFPLVPPAPSGRPVRTPRRGSSRAISQPMLKNVRKALFPLSRSARGAEAPKESNGMKPTTLGEVAPTAIVETLGEITLANWDAVTDSPCDYGR